MWSTRALSALVLGGILAVAAPALADHNKGPGAPDSPAAKERATGLPNSGQPEARDGQVTGEIVKIDKAQGAVLLRTAFGPLALEATPDQLAGLRVGDVVVVTFVQEDDDADEEEGTTQ